MPSHFQQILCNTRLESCGDKSVLENSHSQVSELAIVRVIGNKVA